MPATTATGHVESGHLETGWDATTPPGDTILRQSVDATVTAWEAVGYACGGRVHRGRGFVAVDIGRPTGIMNCAILTEPRVGGELEVAIDEIETFYSAGGSGEVLLWSPWPTPELSRRGWTLEGHPPLLFRQPTGPLAVSAPDELEVVEVSDTAQLDEWNTVVVEAFPLDGVDPSRSPLGPGVLDDDRFSLLLGRVGGRSVVAGSQFVSRDANVLLLTATRPEVRGRGYYGSLVRHRLASTPTLPAVTLVSDHSRPILVDRFGFLPVCRFTLWSRTRP
jgi:hypothetical protein